MVATNPFALGFENSCYVWYPLTQVISGFFLDPEDDTMSPAKATRFPAKKDADTISCRAERPWITLKMPSKSWDCLVARYHLDNFLESARCLSGRSSAFISRACLLGKPPMPGRMAHLNGHRRLYGPCQCHRSKAGKVIRLVERLTDAKVI